MSDPKNPGQSDRTVMLRTDDLNTQDSTDEAIPAARPGQSDATVLGMQIPPDPEAPAARPSQPPRPASTSAPVATPRKPSGGLRAPPRAADPDVITQDDDNPRSNDPTMPPTSRLSPFEPAAAAPRASQIRAAIPDPNASKSNPPKRASQVMSAIPDPNASKSNPPKRASQVMSAIPDPNASKSNPPKRASQVMSAIPDPNASKSNPPRRATGMRQALPDPATMDSQQGQSTVMFDSIKGPLPAVDSQQGQSTVMFDAVKGPALPSATDADSVEPTALKGTRGDPLGVEPTALKSSKRAPAGADLDVEPTAARSLASDDKPTKGTRPLQNLVDGPLEKSEAAPPPETMLGDKARTQNGIQMVAAALLLLVGGAVVARYFLGGSSAPSTDELRLLYPFGQGGAKLKSGRNAPPAAQVTYDLTKKFDCEGAQCITYHLTGSGGMFEYDMTVKYDNGIWSVVGGNANQGRER